MKGAKICILNTIFIKIQLNRQMSHTCQQYKLRFEPRNPIFHVFAGPYFLSLFSEHPVFYTILIFINSENILQQVV